MADNIVTSGGTVMADEVTHATWGTAKSQVIKIMDGTVDGTTVAIVDSKGLRTSTGLTVVRSLTLTLDTSAYASGDVLADTQQYDAFFRVTDGAGIINSITVVDEDDQGVAFDVYFFKANQSLGTENAAPSITDANARDCLGYVAVGASDYRDLGGVRIACVKNIGLPVIAASGTDDLYIGVVNGTSAPTYTASGIKLIFGVLLD